MTPGDQAKCDLAKRIFQNVLTQIESMGVTVKLVHTEEQRPSDMYPRSRPPREVQTFFHLNNVNPGDAQFVFEPNIPEGAVTNGTAPIPPRPRSVS